MPNYGDSTYWDNRYLLQQDASFDWLEDFDSLKFILEDILINRDITANTANTASTTPNVLMLGCGNSSMSERIYKDLNIHKIFNIDISSNVIKNMRERSKDLEGMSWDVMDCRDLKFNQSFFDVVIDKCTMDTLLCGDNPYLNVAMMTKEIQRVLKVSGTYVIVSHSDQESRLPHLTRDHLSFDIRVQAMKKETEEGVSGCNILPHLEQTNYVYACKKKMGADTICQDNFHKVYLELEKENVMEDDEEVLMRAETK